MEWNEWSFVVNLPNASSQRGMDGLGVNLIRTLLLLVTDGQAGLKSGLLPMISTDGMFNPGISVLKKSLRV